MEEVDFQDRIDRLTRATEVAREILSVPAGASDEILSHARREACRKYHPDRCPEEEADGKSFKLAQLAYRCLSNGEDCEKLLREFRRAHQPDSDGPEHPENRWSYFLAWRERFF